MTKINKTYTSQNTKDLNGAIWQKWIKGANKLHICEPLVNFGLTTPPLHSEKWTTLFWFLDTYCNVKNNLLTKIRKWTTAV